MKSLRKVALVYPVLLISVLLSSCEGNNKDTGLDTATSLKLQNTDDFLETTNISSTGTQKILVVPVYYKDEPTFDDSKLELLNKALFEDDLSTKSPANTKYFYSLTEYYKKSSLGKLDIVGEVVDPIYIDATPKDIEDGKAGESKYLPGYAAGGYFYKNYDEDGVNLLAGHEEAEENLKKKLQEYDTDHDGYVDSVIFVYSSAVSDRTGNFWAWVNTMNMESNVEKPGFRRHMWLGYDFLHNDVYDIDAHTPIHEAGHLMGLRDYYPTDAGNNNIALGGHSMMDFNISDHDPYTKGMLGWSDPTYYKINEKDVKQVELKPFESTNDAIILNNNWNHSMLDEYLMIEYYTPNGVNELDAQNKYINSRPLGFTKPGIKIYHIDSRVSKNKGIPSIDMYGQPTIDLEFVEYCKEIPAEKEEDMYYLIAASNSKTPNYTGVRAGRFKQIMLIENKDTNMLQMGATADDESLFYEGDEFDSTTSIFINDNTYNNGDSINVKIKVDNLQEDKATLTISYAK